jgi:hypothetical protein
MSLGAISASEILNRNSDVDFDPWWTPDDLKDKYTHLKTTRTAVPDDDGETEQLWGVKEDGTLERLSWNDDFYDSLRQRADQDDIPRGWSRAELESDAYGRSLNESRYWRERFQWSEQKREEYQDHIDKLDEQLDEQKEFNRQLLEQTTAQRQALLALQEKVEKLEKRPPNPNVVVADDPKRKRRAMLLGGLAVAAGIGAAYLLGRHSGQGPEFADTFKDMMAQNKEMVSEHKILISGIHNLQNTVTHDSKVIHDLRGRVDDDTQLLHQLNSKVHHLQDSLPGKGIGSSGGSGSTTTTTSAGSSGVEKRFYVEKGNGITQEIKQYAQTRGKNISSGRAYDIYREIRAHVGNRIIDSDGVKDNTYTHNGQLRLNQPGWAHWFPKAGAMLSRLVTKS